jgi:hypothetical protein
VGAWAFNEETGKTAFNAVNNGGRSLESSASLGVHGLKIPAIDGAGGVSVPTFNNVLAGTIFVVGIPSSVGSSLQMFFYLPGNRRYIYTDAGSSTVTYALGNTGVGRPNPSSAICVNNVSVSVTMTWSNNGDIGDCYYNGKHVYHIAGNTQNTDILSGGYIGAPAGSFVNYKGYIPCCLIFNCALSSSQIKSLSDNPWQIYEPETIWIEVGGGGGATVFSGTFSSSLDILTPSLSGQLGVGGGITATAGSATYANSGQEGKQGQLSATLAALVQALSGNAGNSGSLAGQNIITGSIAGNSGNLATFASTISITALFASGVITYEGSISSALGVLTASISGNAGVSGTISATVTTGADIAGKLGLSGSFGIILEAMGCQLIEIVIGGKIHRIIISTTTGTAAILTATGTINITTNWRKYYEQISMGNRNPEQD